MGKLTIVFDLDHTLTFTSQNPLPPEYVGVGSCHSVFFDGGVGGFTYVRPYMGMVLANCFERQDTTVALWSCGSPKYVFAILDQVVIPEIKIHCPQFDFAAIFTSADFDEDGPRLKSMTKMLRWTGADSALLVDDSTEQCSYAASGGHSCYNIEPYDPLRGDDDVALLDFLALSPLGDS